jgi:transposase
MRRFVEGEDRSQVTLLPACLDDHVEAENPVRVVEVFVDGLDLGELGFGGLPRRRQPARRTTRRCC